MIPKRWVRTWRLWRKRSLITEVVILFEEAHNTTPRATRTQWQWCWSSLIVDRRLLGSPLHLEEPDADMHARTVLAVSLKHVGTC